MRKVFVIASREYLAAVRTKSFLISLLVLPLMMGGSILAQLLLKDQMDTTEKRFAVVDRTPGQKLFQALQAAAGVRNKKGIFDPKTNKQTKPVYVLEQVEPSSGEPEAINEQRYQLSQRVLSEQIVGFLDIGPSVLEYRHAETPPDSTALDGPAAMPMPSGGQIRYQSNRPTSDEFHHWADAVLKNTIDETRAIEAGMPAGKLSRILTPVPLVTKGLSKRNPQTGAIEEADTQNEIAMLIVPGVLMFLMFMLVIIGATPLMSGVLEEKTQRIAEVMLGSVQPFQMMLGKLLGTVGVSFTLSTIYLSAGYWAAYRNDYAQFIPTDVLVWFFAYQALAVLMFGSLFIAIGAACTDTRETQSMVMPVMLLISSPLFVWVNVIREPTSTFATSVSMIPFATPMLMLARQAVPPGIPWWQPAMGILGVLLTTALCVYAAGRIFRVGILMQGKGAHFGEMVKWVFRG
jgi:ABC-2 type transport system permease protein